MPEGEGPHVLLTEVVNGSPSYNSVNPANRFRSVGARHDLGTVMTFCDGHAYCFKVRNVTNAAIGTTPSGEPRNPEIIWNWIRAAAIPVGLVRAVPADGRRLAPDPDLSSASPGLKRGL